MKIYLFNSISRQIEEFKPINPAEVSIYSCGPTVYNAAHIGNMRAFLFADLLQRTMRTAGKFNVKWVMNITNIDDKTIRDSQPNSNAWPKTLPPQTGQPMADLITFTNYYHQQFINDITKLGIKPEHFYKMPKATDYIPQMQTLITNIVNKKMAYIKAGSVYFNIAEYRKTNTYGKLFHIDFENFKAGLRVDTDQYEREQVADFVLWKAQKNNEPAWQFILNGQTLPGRPGWHIECSAMEYDILGLPFDIHTGGIDLKFPHHEDEIAQAKAGYNIEPTNYWCHNEFLEVEGTKMAKSAGNFYTLQSLENKGLNPTDVRYAMLATHYRTKYNFTLAGIEAARKARTRMQDYILTLIKLHKINTIAPKPTLLTDEIKILQTDVFNQLAADLHTPKALALLFSFISANNANTLTPAIAADFVSLMKEVNNVFECWNFIAEEKEDIPIPAHINQLAERRQAAKLAKNYTLADNLRKEITSAGYNIVDTKNGYEIKR